MKFKESAYTPKAHGKLGGNKFSSNRYGPYSSLKPRTNYTYSVAQSRVTGQFGAVTRKWSQNLNQQQLDAWLKLSEKFKKTDSLGNVYVPPPRDIFMSCNINLREIGLPDILDPPENYSVQTYQDFKLEISYDADNYMDIHLFFDPPLEPDTRIVIFATMILKLCNNSFQDRWFKKIGCVDSRFKSGDSIQKLYASIFPLTQRPKLTPTRTFSLPFKIAFRLKTVSAISGFASPLIKTSASYIPNDPSLIPNSQISTCPDLSQSNGILNSQFSILNSQF